MGSAQNLFYLHFSLAVFLIKINVNYIIGKASNEIASMCGATVALMSVWASIQMSPLGAESTGSLALMAHYT